MTITPYDLTLCMWLTETQDNNIPVDDTSHPARRPGTGSRTCNNNLQRFRRCLSVTTSWHHQRSRVLHVVENTVWINLNAHTDELTTNGMLNLALTLLMTVPRVLVQPIYTRCLRPPISKALAPRRESVISQLWRPNSSSNVSHMWYSAAPRNIWLLFPSASFLNPLICSWKRVCSSSCFPLATRP